MTPIAFMADDGCPLVHVYQVHSDEVHHRTPVSRNEWPQTQTRERRRAYLIHALQRPQTMQRGD